MRCRLGLFLFLGLQGCVSSDPEVRGVDYLKNPPVEISVRCVQVKIRPSVDNDPGIGLVSLVDMTKQWAKEHWVAVGGSPVLKITLCQAKVQEESVKANSNSVAWLTMEHKEKYSGQLTVLFELFSRQGQRVESLSITVSGEKYVPENYSITQRRVLLLSLYEDLLNRLTREADKALAPLIEIHKGDCS